MAEEEIRQPVSAGAPAKQEKSAAAKKEEEILKFWKDNNIFKKSLEKKSPKGDFVFYDGPPFANGLPHYGHILPGTIKDVIPRYKTMRGYRVERRWGWDCHGLPVENLVEQELGFKTKKDIENFSIAKFNENARASVSRYADDWREIIPRTGRFVDMENDYRTMDSAYTESIWSIFKTLYDKKLIYEGFKAMHLCPRCETTLSNFEVSQGYKDVTDLAVTVKFELESEPGTYLLAWTTTPWTLPGNAALAVNEKIIYCKLKTRIPESQNDIFIVAKERVSNVFRDDYEIMEEFSGRELLGKIYKPLFNYYAENTSLKNRENGWKVYAADFVGADEGTGIVHIAPAFGEDDMNIGKENNLPFIQHVASDGTFTEEVRDFKGMFVKPKENPQQTDVEIIKYLASKNLLFAKEKITHTYPHCWRCDTPLLNYAASSWFVAVTKIKNKLVEENAKVHWTPPEIGSGRFGNWLLGARDWAISRSRYWGAPIPVWKKEDTWELRVIGSLKDLKNCVLRSGNRYIAMRHGESLSNVKGIISSFARNNHPLTEKGKEEARAAGKMLEKEKPSVIIASPFMRTKETAEIVAKICTVDSASVIYDDRIGEINLGELDGRPVDAYRSFAGTYEERFMKAPSGGETLCDLKRRLGEFIYEIEKRYSGKTILIISHEYVAWILAAISEGADVPQTVRIKNEAGDDFLKTGGFKEIEFIPIPHNENYELDLHRPYIDDILVQGGFKRVPEVFDCWFESGAMPYGQFHYPFDSTQGKPFEKIFNPKKKRGFPADFIAESLDQTRGWFYSSCFRSRSFWQIPVQKRRGKRSCALGGKKDEQAA